MDFRLVVFLARMSSGCRRDADISLVATRFDTAPRACSDTLGSFRYWGGILFSVLDDTWSATPRTPFHFAWTAVDYRVDVLFAVADLSGTDGAADMFASNAWCYASRSRR